MRRDVEMKVSIVKWSELEKAEVAFMSFLLGSLVGIVFMYLVA